eukprot:5018812-Pyramimonas_sp.AAC.1
MGRCPPPVIVEWYSSAMTYCSIPYVIQHAMIESLVYSDVEISWENLDFDQFSKVSWDRCIRTGGPEG